MRVARQISGLAVGLVLGCSGGGEGPAEPEPAISLSLSATGGSTVQGGSTTVTGTLTRSGGYSGTVTFTVEGVPAGVTGSAGNVTTTGTSTTVTITIQAAPDAQPGTSTITIRATGSGVDPTTRSYQLTVMEMPDFGIAVQPASANMVQGTSRDDIAVTLTRTNFPAGVTLSLGGPVPAGVSASFAPAAPTTNASTMTLTVGATSPPGTYTLEVTGTGAPGTRTASFVLTITHAGSVALSIAPAGPITLVQGGSDNSRTVTISRTNYTRNITLSAENLPAGVSATFAPNGTAGTNATLTLTAAANAALGGPVTVTIRGSGPDVLDATTTIGVSVKAPGTFGIAVSPAGAVAMFPGGSDNSRTVTITRTSYDAPITLVAEGLPAGLTAAFDPNPASGGSSTMTLTASGSVAPGDYTITIRGSGPLARGGPAALADVQATTTLLVTINALGSFTLGMVPVCNSGVQLSQGELDDVRLVTITRSNFPVGVQLAVEGLPAGMTASFAPNPATGPDARLTIAAGATTPIGTYNLTIRGTGPASNVTLPLTVFVVAGSMDVDDLDYPFNGGLENWLPGGTCGTTVGGDWGNAFWNSAYGGVAHFDGVGNPGVPNAWITKLQSIPATAHTLQFDAAGFIFPGSDAVLRVRVLDGGVSTTIFDQVIVGGVDPPVFTTKTADIRPWAGRTVRLFIEQDANAPDSHEHIFVDNVRILTALGANWQYRKPITISTGASGTPAGYSVAVEFDHAALVAAGKSLPSGDDVRIVYSNGTSSWELDRRRERGSSWNSVNTRIWFATQAPIGANQNNGHYYIYYGNPAAGAPPANRLRVFLFEDDFEGGSLSRWTITSGGLWTADNARAHDGTFSVMYPPETQKATVMFPNLGITESDVYVESWWYLDSPSTSYKTSLQVHQQPNGNHFQGNLYQNGTGWGVARFVNPTFTQVMTTAGVAPVGTWFRVGTGIHGSTMRVFVNGTEVVVANGMTQLGAGTVGLGKFEIPAGAGWWADDFVARRFVYPEPTNVLGAEQVGPFSAGPWVRKP